MSTVTSTYFRYIQIPFLSILRTKKKESKCFVVRFLMRPGAECSPERLEAGPAFGFGPLAALLNLPPLLHPLWAALKKKTKKKNSCTSQLPSKSTSQTSLVLVLSFDSFTLDMVLTWAESQAKQRQRRKLKRDGRTNSSERKIPKPHLSGRQMQLHCTCTASFFSVHTLNHFKESSTSSIKAPLPTPEQITQQWRWSYIILSSKL